MAPSAVRRVVITGVGAVTPLGNDPHQLVAALREGQSGIRPLTRIPRGVLATDHGGEAIDFTGDIGDYGPLEKPLQRTIRKGSKVMCREIEMGVAVAQHALRDAGFSPESFDRDRTGVIYGCDYIMSLPEEYAEGIASCIDEQGRFRFERWGQRGLPKVNPLWLLKYLPNMPASHIAIYNDLRGPNNSITVREASAGAALAESVSTLQRGHADALVVGATGTRIHPLRTLHASLQEPMAPARDDPAEMSRPFDRSREGVVLSEGAAAIVCETLEHAESRGARILGEIVGGGTSAVGPRYGDGFLKLAIENAIRAALGSADPAAIGHIHAHGKGTPEADRQEAAAIAAVFGTPDVQPPVTTAKGHLGGMGAGAAMVELVASLLSLGGPLFPIRNLRQIDPECPIRGVGDRDTPAGDEFVSIGYSPQGQAAAVRVRRWDG